MNITLTSDILANLVENLNVTLMSDDLAKINFGGKSENHFDE